VANQILLQLLNGLVVGSSLALVAAGLALLFGVLHIINFAQGDFFMMGGYAVWFALSLTHNYVAAMVLGTVLVAIVGGLLLTALIWPLLQRSQVLVLLATLGLSLILQQLATNILGGDTKLVQPPLSAAVAIGPTSSPASSPSAGSLRTPAGASKGTGTPAKKNVDDLDDDIPF